MREEATHSLLRWAEPVLVGLCALALGIWGLRLGLAGGYVGWGMLGFALVVGGGWLRAALVTARTERAAKEEPPTVFVEERRILIVGPFGVSQIDLDEIHQVQVSVSRQGKALFLERAAGPPAVCPYPAEGTAEMIGALSGLPGLHAERLLTALNARKQGISTVWRRG